MSRKVVKLDICGGENRIASDFINIDIRRSTGADIVADLRHGLPVRSGAASEIFSCGTLEHLSLSEVRQLLAEFRRVLRPAGALTVGVPDLEKLMASYSSGEVGFDLFNQYLYGAQENPYDLHKSIYDARNLMACLESCGFVEVRQSPYDLPFHRAQYMMKITCLKPGEDGEEVFPFSRIKRLEFTGERVVPGLAPRDLYFEHLARYLFAAQFARGLNVLDVGCGCGYGSALIASSAAKVAACDISAEAIEYARTRYKRDNLKFLVSDASRLPFPSGSFQILLAFELIEHLKDARSFLEEALRVLSEDGIAVISTPNRLTYMAADGALNPYHVREFDPHELAQLLSPYFKKVEILAQNRVEGYAISNLEGGQPNLCAADGVPVFADGDSPRGESALRQAQYLMALCSQSQRPIPSEKGFVLFDGRSNIIDQLRESAKQMAQAAQSYAERLKENYKVLRELTEQAGRYADLAKDYAARLSASDQKSVELSMRVKEYAELASKNAAALALKDEMIGRLLAEQKSKTVWGPFSAAKRVLKAVFHIAAVVAINFNKAAAGLRKKRQNRPN